MKAKRTDDYERTVYVIRNGTLVMNPSHIPGVYMKIPRHYKFQGKARTEYEALRSFLEQANKLLKVYPPSLKYIFDSKGDLKYKLSDIPEIEHIIVVSSNHIFTGIRLSNPNTGISFSSDIHLESLRVNVKTSADNQRRKLKIKDIFKRKKKRKVELKTKLVNYANYTKVGLERLYSRRIEHYREGNRKILEQRRSNRERNQNNIFKFGSQSDLDLKLSNSRNEAPDDSSFIRAVSDTEACLNKSEHEHEYYSDDSKSNTHMKRSKIQTEISSSESARKKLWKSLMDFAYNHKIKHLRKKLSSNPINQNAPRRNTKSSYTVATKKGLIRIGFEDQIANMENYIQETRGVKEKEVSLGDVMGKWFKRLQIIKEANNTVDIDERKLCSRYRKNFIKLNILKNTNPYFQAERAIESKLKDLISQNIPKICSKYPTLNRITLYDMFTQYKSIVKITCAKTRSMKAPEGINFLTFKNGIPQMINESHILSKLMFAAFNEKGNGFLSWEEFMKGMIIIKSKDIGDKLNLFFKIIDTDGNGLLSYDEVEELSHRSLQRSPFFSDSDDPMIKELANYFADLIFQLVSIDRDKEIPLPAIREVGLFLFRLFSKVVRLRSSSRCSAVRTPMMIHMI